VIAFQPFSDVPLKVIAVSVATVNVQVEPQSIPAGELMSLHPAPVLVTVNVAVGGVDCVLLFDTL
jgi:hypothetical protein